MPQGNSLEILPMLKPNDPRQNHILAALPSEARERLYPQLELVPMPLGDVLYESGTRLRHVYFPTNCIVSLLYVMEDGASAEIASWAMRGSSESHSSWEARRRQVARLCRAQATPSG
jgi:hypothetical protein